MRSTQYRTLFLFWVYRAFGCSRIWMAFFQRRLRWAGSRHRRGQRYLSLGVVRETFSGKTHHSFLQEVVPQVSQGQVLDSSRYEHALGSGPIQLLHAVYAFRRTSFCCKSLFPSSSQRTPSSKRREKFSSIAVADATMDFPAPPMPVKTTPPMGASSSSNGTTRSTTHDILTNFLGKEGTALGPEASVATPCAQRP